MQGIEVDEAGFAAWNELWVGALSVHNRHLRLTVQRTPAEILWKIA